MWKSVLSEDLVAMGLPREWKWRYYLTHRIAVFMRVMRICEYYRGMSGAGKVVYLLNRFRYERLSETMGFDIPLGTCGPGFSIAHRGLIIINGDVRIGPNCRIHPGVTIGAIRGKSPIIGSNVFIGPSVGIYGPVRIGDGAVLGPSSLINFDVPPGCTTFGTLAILREGRS